MKTLTTENTLRYITCHYTLHILPNLILPICKNTRLFLFHINFLFGCTIVLLYYCTTVLTNVIFYLILLYLPLFQLPLWRIPNMHFLLLAFKLSPLWILFDYCPFGQAIGSLQCVYQFFSTDGYFMRYKQKFKSSGIIAPALKAWKHTPTDHTRQHQQLLILFKVLQ